MGVDVLDSSGRFKLASKTEGGFGVSEVDPFILLALAAALFAVRSGRDF